ncbi:amidohydrolase family protein [Paenibacillus sepulcri]
MTRIDAHQHYWNPERIDYGWLTEKSSPILYRNYSPSDLEPELEAAGMDRTILVQAATHHEETYYMLELSEQYESIAGVVGWLDLNDPDWAVVLESFRNHPKFLGFRLMIQDMPEPSEILRPIVIEALREIAKMDLPVDLVAMWHQLPVVLELLRNVPGLRVVIDHLAKPQIKAGIFEPWATQMREIASYPKIYCKLSGLVTEADHEAWKPEDFTAYVAHIVDIFGTDRIMYGSDWPVCLLAGSYSQVHQLLGRVLPDSLTEAELEALYGGNAAAFYKL